MCFPNRFDIHISHIGVFLLCFIAETALWLCCTSCQLCYIFEIYQWPLAPAGSPSGEAEQVVFSLQSTCPPTGVARIRHRSPVIIYVQKSRWIDLNVLTLPLSSVSSLSLFPTTPCPSPSSLQPVLTVAFSTRCLKEAACISAVHSVVTSSAVAATTLSTL